MKVIRIFAARATLAWMFAFRMLGVAKAAAPFARQPAPAFYRMMLGDFEITVLSDGTLPLPVSKVLKNIRPAALDAVLKRSFLSNPVETSFNTFLINTGSKLVLLDAGAGTLMGPGTGHLLANLQAAGYTAEQIDEVYITDMHTDHVGGLMVGDKRAFPNAIVRADQHEADQWLSAANRDASPPQARQIYQAAMASLNPYVAARKFKSFAGKTALAPGITAIPSPGHTLGHTSYLIESKGEILIIWGDIVHVSAVQFANPSVTTAFDTDAQSAEKQRSEAFASAAAEGYWVGAPHIEFPGIGHVRAEGAAYVWIPASFSQPHL